MKYTILITREFDPDAYIATVPILDVVTYGDTVDLAIAAAREAITLDLRGRKKHREDIPIEPAENAQLPEVAIDADGAPEPRMALAHADHAEPG